MVTTWDICKEILQSTARVMRKPGKGNGDCSFFKVYIWILTIVRSII